MSGHSKWATIKHKKAAQDAKRGRVFTRVIKEISIAARAGGGDPDGNPRLRTAIAAAKAVNMPADNIKRAILKGTGELPGMTLEEVAYEGYGPGGVAIYVHTLTDNRMRTTPEIRHLFTKHGGSLSDPNSVAWMFERKGHFGVPRTAVGEERLLEIVLEAGGEDLHQADDEYQISTSPEVFHEVQQALERAGIVPGEAALVFEPKNTVELEGKQAQQCLRLLDVLQDHDDVQNVYANLEVDESALEDDSA
jgi:YebC/PmpR family DNA-binding regulatory protein